MIRIGRKQKLAATIFALLSATAALLFFVIHNNSATEVEAAFYEEGDLIFDKADHIGDSPADVAPTPAKPARAGAGQK